MNKRQRKKMFIRAFSKAYDESLKYRSTKEQVSITTVRDIRGKSYIITSITSQVEIMKNWTVSHDEITIYGYILDNNRLGLK